MNNSWTPWHKVISLRPDLKSGELSLNIFAADLYDVAMQRGARPVYEDPAEFFALTYPTYNLRELAREVVLRLFAGLLDRAPRMGAGLDWKTALTWDPQVLDTVHQAIEDAPKALEGPNREGCPA